MKPILFNTEMVRALLEGRKTVTRRIIKPQPPHTARVCSTDGRFAWAFWEAGDKHWIRAQYNPGDILYVRETWGNYSYDNRECNAAYFLYRADYEPNAKGYWYGPEHVHFCDFPRWRPSIHMPKEAARLFLRVTNVRVERLQDMTEDDVCAEGAEPLIHCPLEHPTYGPDGTLGDMCWNTDCCSKCEYISKSNSELFGEYIWDSTIKKADLPLYGWAANPWIWVIEFERISKEEAEHETDDILV